MPSLEGWHSMRGTGTLWGGHQAGAPNQNDRPIEWDAIKDNIDLAAIATALLGPAPAAAGSAAAACGGPARSMMTGIRHSA